MTSRDQEHMWRLAARYSSVGIEMAAGVSIGTLGGWWLDERFDTAPLLLILGLIIGTGAAVKAVVRVVRRTDMSKL